MDLKELVFTIEPQDVHTDDQPPSDKNPTNGGYLEIRYQKNINVYQFKYVKILPC